MSRKGRGVFIVLDGPDGCGKSTQARRLARELRGRGLRVRTARDPGGTALGRKIRKLLLDGRDESLDGTTELHLYLAARSRLVREVIRPALAEGEWLLCDRFSSSTVAYQGYGQGKRPDRIRQCCLEATEGLEPDLTLILDLPPQEGLRRIRRGKDRMERKPLSYHRRVRRGFLTQAAQAPSRFAVLPACAPPAATTRQILNILYERRLLG
jgi:dTMP kinase